MPRIPLMIAALLTGFGIGLLVALQVEPIFLLCARTSARFGFAPGAAIGMGAASADAAYAVLGALGATVLLAAAPLRLALESPERVSWFGWGCARSTTPSGCD